MATCNVVLTSYQAAFLDGLVASGRYQNVSEAMRAGLRLLERDEAEWERVKAGVREGLAQDARGEFVEGEPEEIFGAAHQRALSRLKS